jgi:signal transduction histidine kinase
MALELAEIAAGLPLAASFALAGGITTLREGRRRTALNEAMHELRRPLQVLALTFPAEAGELKAADSSLRLAINALEHLDREINGDSAGGRLTPLPLRPLLEEAVERWRGQATLRGTNIQLCWSSGEIWLEGDRSALAQAVDNLISNGFEHGGGEVTVIGSAEGSWLLVSVRDAGEGDPKRGRLRHPFGINRSRHGHGLRVVARVANAHGGSFELRRSDQGTEARLRLPVLATGEEG